MYVYQRNDEGKDILLTPYRKHEYTYATDQRDTSHRNAPPLCRAVTVRLQLIKKMPSPFTDMPEMPINRWLAGKHGACGRSTLLPLRLHSMGCQRDSCSCQWDSWGQQRDSLSQYWDSCSGEKTVSILVKTVSVSQKSLTVFPRDSLSCNQDSFSRHPISCSFAHGTLARTLLCMWREMMAKWKG